MGRAKSRKIATPPLEKKEEKRKQKEIIRQLGEPNFNYFFISPVRQGYIRYTDLINGGLTLFDIRKMNEAITYLNDVDRVISNLNNSKDGRKTR